MTWAWILGASLACYLLKLAGLSVPHRVLSNRRVQIVAGLMPVALFAALIATQTFSSGRTLTLDARALGLAAAGGAVLLRAPFIVVVAVAAVSAALVRLL